MSIVRRLDHVAVLVRDTEKALGLYRDHLGLAVHSTEEILAPHVRLTYVDAGNAYVQLVEPLDELSLVAAWLNEHGEGLHHICFGVDDVPAAVAALSNDGATATYTTGRGRLSSFVTMNGGHGVRIECTEFDRVLDVERIPGWLAS